MTGCTDCFNGCADIISDQCVKYTGIDIPELNINKGDTLLSVENAVLKTLAGIVPGVEIFPIFPFDNLCSFVKDLVPPGPDPRSMNTYFRAAFVALCLLKDTTNNLETKLGILETVYNLGCLPSSINNRDTHAVLQGLIIKACQTATDLTGVATDLSTNYVKISAINTYIAQYIANQGIDTIVNKKMIPYVALEYYGPLNNFDADGAGIGDWVNVYLCNGNNGTPDKRGRVAVGATTGMLGAGFAPEVDPAIAGNPNYTLGTPTGTNLVPLTQANMPSHNHGTTVSDPGHFHNVSLQLGDDEYSGGRRPASRNDRTETTQTSVAYTGIVVSLDYVGGSQPHANVQPGIGCYYIMYRP
jgi:microcystin-dependent protein